MHAMSDPAALASMLPFDSIGLYEQPKPRFIFKMPRVVPDQKANFETEDLFKRLSRESEVIKFFFKDVKWYIIIARSEKLKETGY